MGSHCGWGGEESIKPWLITEVTQVGTPERGGGLGGWGRVALFKARLDHVVNSGLKKQKQVW